uniref:Pyrin domain-containing protein n=1 Tax=Sander lucioperca TaxID=283035 RepID=A0A8D0CS23_SANLU
LMKTPKEVVLTTLENLGTEDFEKFKWYLQGVLKDFLAIPKSKLENVNRENTVDTMFQTYSINTINVTRIVLVKIHQNELVKTLSNIIYEPAGHPVHISIHLQRAECAERGKVQLGGTCSSLL